MAVLLRLLPVGSAQAVPHSAGVEAAHCGPTAALPALNATATTTASWAARLASHRKAAASRQVVGAARQRQHVQLAVSRRGSGLLSSLARFKLIQGQHLRLGRSQGCMARHGGPIQLVLGAAGKDCKQQDTRLHRSTAPTCCPPPRPQVGAQQPGDPHAPCHPSTHALRDHCGAALGKQQQAGRNCSSISPNPPCHRQQSPWGTRPGGPPPRSPPRPRCRAKGERHCRQHADDVAHRRGHEWRAQCREWQHAG